MHKCSSFAGCCSVTSYLDLKTARPTRMPKIYRVHGCKGACASAGQESLSDAVIFPLNSDISCEESGFVQNSDT